MFSRSKVLWLGLGLSLAACGITVTPPVNVEVVDLLPNGLYGPTTTSLETVTNLTGLKGTPVSFIGGAWIVEDYGDPLLAGNPNPPDSVIHDVFLKGSGADVRVNYLVHSAVYWPVDFHSWNMVTGYYNFERAFQHMNNLGIVTPDEISNTPVYYFPDYTITQISPIALDDNARYDSALHAFIILPFDQLQGLPVPMNRGAIAHEFSHLVFNKRVFAGAGTPAPYAAWSAPSGVGSYQPAFKVLQSLDEGLADYHAVESLCEDPTDDACDDTLFLEPTIGADAAKARDLAEEGNCLDSSLINSINVIEASDPFLALGRQYEVGTVIGSSLYIAGKRVGGRKALEKDVLRAYDDTDTNNRGLQQWTFKLLDDPGTFDLPFAVNIIVSHIPEPNLREQVCDEFLERLRLQPNQLPACPASAAPLGVCPPL